MEPNVVALTSEQKRGRAVLAAAFGIWLFMALCIDVLFLALGHVSALPIICVRLVLTVALFYAVWIGRNWARWLTVIFFAIAFLSAVRHFRSWSQPFSAGAYTVVPGGFFDVRFHFGALKTCSCILELPAFSQMSSINQAIRPQGTPR